MAAPGLSKRASRAGFTGRLHTCARAPPRSLDQELWGWSLNPHVSESHVAFCGERPGQVRPPPARVTCPLPPLRVRTCSAISVLWNTGTGAAWHGVRDKTALVVLPLRVLQGDSMPWVTSVAWSSAWCSSLSKAPQFGQQVTRLPWFKATAWTSPSSQAQQHRRQMTVDRFSPAALRLLHKAQPLCP